MNELLNKAITWFDLLGIITATRNNKLYVLRSSIEAADGLQPKGTSILMYLLAELRKDCGTNKYYWAEIGEEWLQVDTM
jgi:hypothetical protein